MKVILIKVNDIFFVGIIIRIVKYLLRVYSTTFTEMQIQKRTIFTLLGVRQSGQKKIYSVENEIQHRKQKSFFPHNTMKSTKVFILDIFIRTLLHFLKMFH